MRSDTDNSAMSKWQEESGTERNKNYIYEDKIAKAEEEGRDELLTSSIQIITVIPFPHRKT